jgi:hypothetical protein
MRPPDGGDLIILKGLSNVKVLAVLSPARALRRKQR